MRLNMTESGQGRPVVLLHGLFGASANLGTLARRLAARFRVLSVDLRNHGASPHAPDMGYAAMAADVAETIDGIIEPVALVGHSMGGKVAMRLALDAPARVSALMVSDIAPVPYQTGFRRYAQAMQALDVSPALTRAAADAALADTIADPGVRAFLMQNLRFGTAPAWRIGLDQIAAGLDQIEDWPPSAAHFTGPALFLSGERSDYIRPEHRPTIRTLFPAARFVSVKAAGHWIHADNPDGFALSVTAFLDAVTPA